MTTKQIDPTVVFLRDVRVTFPKLFKEMAEQFEGKGDPYCSASFILPTNHPDMPALKAAIRAAAEKKWPGKSEVMVKSAQAKDKLPVHDGELKAHKPYGAAYAGLMYVSARNNMRTGIAPMVFDSVQDPATGQARVISSPSDPKAPYSGCYVNVKLSLYGYNEGGGQGVGASIAGVQFVRDGERLAGGAVAAADDFEAIPEVAGNVV